MGVSESVLGAEMWYTYVRLVVFCRVIEERSEKYLSRQKVCIFNMLAEQNAGASTIVMKSTHAPSIVWSEDYSVVMYNDTRVVLNDVRAGLAQAVADVASMLKVVVGEVACKIDEGFSESFSVASMQHSFLNHAGLERQHLVVLGRLMDADSPHQLCDVRGGEVHWKIANCVKLLNFCEKINELLTVLCFMVPSQAPRGSEFVDFRIRNSDNLRNVFFSWGVWLINQRLKTSSVTESYDFLPMLCPKSLERVLLDYLVLVRPIEAILAEVCWGVEARATYEEFLWVRNGRRLSADSFGIILGNISEERFGVRLTRLSWRHCSIAWRREFIPGMALYVTEDVGDRAAGHSTGIANSTYAKVVGSLGNETTETMRQFRAFSMEWHDVLGMGRNAVPVPLEVKRRQQSNRQGREVVERKSGMEDVVKEAIGREMEGRMADMLAEAVGGAVEKALEEVLPGLISGQFGRMVGVVEKVVRAVVRGENVGGEEGSAMEVDDKDEGQRAGDVDVEMAYRDEGREDGPGRVLVPSSSPFGDEGRGQGLRTRLSAEQSTPLSGWSPLPDVIPETQYSKTSSEEGEGSMVGGFAGVSGRSSARDISPRADWSQLEGVIREREGGMTSEEGLERSSIGADGRAVGKGGDVARRGYDRRKALVALEAVVGCPGASWRSREQEEMVRLALERVENFIVVLPTGGGKSLAWEVPLLVERGEGGMNVLFSAFVTLSEDIRRRTTSHGVKAVMWGKVAGRGMGGETPELVIAAIESLKTKGLQV